MRNEREAPTDRESIKVLTECIDLQIKKSQDYQNPASTILQSDHYRRGIDTIHDMLSQKMLRAESLLSTGGEGNFESLEDTYKDIINYASFAVSYLRGRMEGQYPDRDMFNKPKPVLADKLDTEIVRPTPGGSLLHVHYPPGHSGVSAGGRSGGGAGL